MAKSKNDRGSTPVVEIATCVPRQHESLADKLKWLREAVKKTKCDLFITPQEYFGGFRGLQDEKHIPLSWVKKKVGAIAKSAKKCIGIGAVTTEEQSGATEDFMYFDSNGRFLGGHKKYALPSYDDIRANGEGQVWPETDFVRRTTPVPIPELHLSVGTVFCWEVFSSAIWTAYGFAGVNLIVHPIKFAPRAWPKVATDKNKVRRVISFASAAGKGRDLWKEKLIDASAQTVFCPIAVSCNSWGLGDKYHAMCGHLDEMMGTTELEDTIPCLAAKSTIKVFQMKPLVYKALDHLFGIPQYKTVCGTVDHYNDFEIWKMHFKIRRLEARLIGGDTRLSCQLKAATLARQSKSVLARAKKGRINDV